MPARQQFIILPPRGLQANVVSPTPAAVEQFLTSLEFVRTSGSNRKVLAAARVPSDIRVIDSIHENGAKLVEMSPESVSALRAREPGIRIVPVVHYFPALAPRMAVAKKFKATAASTGTIDIVVASAGDGAPVTRATVVAFTDFDARVGAQAKTNASGVARLALGGSSKKLERLYVYPNGGFWNGFRKNFQIKTGTKVALEPIALDFTDCLRHFYGNSPLTAGSGLTVGVVDTGIEPHPDLVIAGGTNTVPGEDSNDFGDNGEGHGTHCAGIIAARGTPPHGIRGIAPGVKLRSYRVFPEGDGGASNFSIAKALDRAVTDGCDLINMSLGGGPQDEATHSAIAHARANGVLVFVANGNDDRSPVSFPAADSLAMAVSAMGRKGTFPPKTTEVDDVAAPFGKDKKDFVASFSNIGSETDLTGTGVGIISTFPGGYAVMDGTSMACPSAVGAAAKLLSSLPAITSLPRNEARSDAMAKAVLDAAKPRGFGAIFEGQGLLV
ncbi:MAG TPA: S8 family serine peptidase [Gemmatimonadaceae bacterium]|nr:S8 family serine peptidase [Gemmatimonadaceae bacterium]